MTTTAVDDQFAPEPIQELEQKHHDKIVGIIAEKIEADRRPAQVEPSDEELFSQWEEAYFAESETTLRQGIIRFARALLSRYGQAPAGDGDAHERELAAVSGQSAALFRKKPVTIEAIQWTGRNLKEVIDFTGKHPRWHEWFSTWEDYERHVQQDGQRFKIFTLEGTMIAEPGDWIIRGVKGEHYPCKPDIFAATYEQAGWAPAAATVPVAAQASRTAEPSPLEKDLAMAIRKLVGLVRRLTGPGDVYRAEADKTLDLLRRHGLQGSPLRQGGKHA